MSYSVRFVDVSKRYLRGGRAHSLRDAVAYRARNWGIPRKEPGFLAVEDLTFDVEKGESFGLVGPNGAGKTTTLKLLTRVLTPTAGEIRVRGRVGALLEVGSGIHPELSGRENIWLYGQILGITKSQIRARFDEIVSFAELEAAIDKPVKMYSSGMQLRLGFAVAAHTDPEIFVIDEALAVGDATFQAKCVKRMRQFVDEGRTLIYVSHNLAEVETLCQTGIFMLGGKIATRGTSREILAAYLDWVSARRPVATPSSQSHPVTITSAFCTGAGGVTQDLFSPRDGLEIHLEFRSDRIERPHVNIGITDGRAGELIYCSMLEDGQAPDVVGPGRWSVTCRIQEMRLRPRLYEVFCNVFASDGFGTLTDWAAVTTFRVEDRVGKGPAALIAAQQAGSLDVDYTWLIEPSIEDAGASDATQVPFPRVSNAGQDQEIS